MAANARAGRVKALASSGQTRSPVTPDVPTVSEAGVPGYEATIWLGLMAPAGTPRPILEKLNVEINKVVNAPEVKEAWAKQGAVRWPDAGASTILRRTSHDCELRALNSR